MNLDPTTVTYLIVVGACTMSIGLFALGRSYPSYMKGITRWTYGTLLQALGWLLLGVLGSIPDSVFQLIGNAIILLGMALYYHALKEFKEEPFPTVIPYSIVGVVFVSLFYFSAIVENPIARTGLISAGAATLMFMSGRILVLTGATSRPFSYWFTGLGFLACSIMLAAQALSALLAWALLDSSQWQLIQESFRSVYSLSFYVAVIALSFGFMLICHDRYVGEVEHLVMLDPLTQSYTRRALDYLIEKEISRSARTGSPLSVLMIDVDRFKFINDSYGHAAGDRVLMHVARTIAAWLREQDFIGRYGGDEFLVVLPDATGEDAVKIAERMRSVVEQTKIVIVHTSLAITLSIGVTELDHAFPEEQSLIGRADSALYGSKHRGGNCVQYVASR